MLPSLDGLRMVRHGSKPLVLGSMPPGQAPLKRLGCSLRAEFNQQAVRLLLGASAWQSGTPTVVSNKRPAQCGAKGFKSEDYQQTAVLYRPLPAANVDGIIVQPQRTGRHQVRVFNLW